MTTTDAYSVLAGPKRDDGRQEIHRVQVFYETSPEGGSFRRDVDRRERKAPKQKIEERYLEILSTGGRR